MILKLLGVAFIALKLMNHIAWSWWLVTLPLYGPPTLAATILLFALLFASQENLLVLLEKLKEIGISK